jgi:hypothetical protein
MLGCLPKIKATKTDDFEEGRCIKKMAPPFGESQS